jgi:5-hydroxyisourate hydrolase-like protein (transthyretin family)
MKLTIKGSGEWAGAGQVARVLAFMTLVAFNAPIAMAQQRVTGTVIDRNSGHPVAAAKVSLEGDVLRTERSATTDIEGRFSLSVLSPGSYTLTVSADRFYA